MWRKWGIGMKTFAAIDIGSYEIAMKIFEISEERGIREIDHLRHRIELGSDSYFTGKISYERIDELCRILREFTDIMKSYRVEEYKAYGTSAIRETKNTLILLDQIRMRTGIEIEVLGNSAQRFLDYKSVASKGEDFKNIIEKGTAFIDIGGGSIQISLFDQDSLVTTQNIRPGVLRLREEINRISYKSYQLDELVEELLSDSYYDFSQMYVQDREIENIILVDDYVSLIVQKNMVASNAGIVSVQDFLEFVDGLKYKKSEEIAQELGIPRENTSLLYLSALLIQHQIKTLVANMLSAPCVSLCDGMAYEFAEKHKLLLESHNFEQDILAAARDINKRYLGSETRIREREEIALTLFDHLEKLHGLTKRERLLLQLSAILCDCGRFISLNNVGESSFNIIMSTEMIGLSHLERSIVAYVAKYVSEPFEYYETLGTVTTLSEENYLIISKLTAILRLAEGLVISHREKCEQVGVDLQPDSVVITVETAKDMTLERGLFGRSADFFEEVFNMKPSIRQIKNI